MAEAPARIAQSNSPFDMTAGQFTIPTLVLRDRDNAALEDAIQMAEGYLLSDLSFQESWEVHRRPALQRVASIPGVAILRHIHFRICPH